MDKTAEKYREVQPPKHLVYLVHGLNGNQRNWSYSLSNFQNHPSLGSGRVLYERSQSFQYIATSKGIDFCGDRLLDEIQQTIAKHPTLASISFIAHSMGGLIARYAAGKAFNPKSGTIFGLAPRHFVTLATPHVGCSPAAGNSATVPMFATSNRWIQRLLIPASSVMFRASGRQLYLVDHLYDGQGNDLDEIKPWEGGVQPEPLLLSLCKDVESGPRKGYYFSALAAFETRTAYANVAGDKLVGWANASIRHVSDLPPLDKSVLKCCYSGIVHEDPPAAGRWPSSKASASLGYGNGFAIGLKAAAGAAPGGPTSVAVDAREGSQSVLLGRDLKGNGNGSGSQADDRSQAGSTVSLFVSSVAPSVAHATGLRYFAPEEDRARALEVQLANINECVDRLKALPWRRIDVSFGGSGQAHNHIQVSRVFINFPGRRAVEHLVRTFDELEACVEDQMGADLEMESAASEAKMSREGTAPAAVAVSVGG